MIREMRTTDFDNIIDIMKMNATEAGTGIGAIDEKELYQMLRDLFIKPGYKIFVNDNGKITGFIVCQAIKNPWNGRKEGNIIFHYVIPAYRNGFTAKNLLAQAESWFRNLDCEYFMADVRAWQADYSTNQEFVEQGHNFFGKMMNHCGYCYVKEIL
jgi:ribosomal protein S18 acetylase RimI-like enzyme